MFLQSRCLLNPFEPRAFLNRLLLLEGLVDHGRIEHQLAVMRLCLAGACLLAASFYPPDARVHMDSRQICLMAYLFGSIGVVLLLPFWAEAQARISFCIHALDLIFIATFSVFTVHPSNIFHILFLFILLSASYRWGFWDTIATALGVAVLIVLGNAFVQSHLHFVLFHSRTAFGSNFLAPSGYLLLQSFVVGFLAGEVKKQRVESFAISRTLGHIRAEADLTTILEGVCGEILRLFGARKVLIAVCRKNSDLTQAWCAVPSGLATDPVELTELGPDREGIYFFELPKRSLFGRKSGEAQNAGYLVCSIKEGGWLLQREQVSLPAGFFAQHPCDSFFVDSKALGQELELRLFLLDPLPEMSGASALNFLHLLFARIASALINALDASMAGRRVAEVERASLAHELHDGTIQTLIAIEMQLAVLGKSVSELSDSTREKIGGIQEYLHNEILNLRALMQRLKHLELAPKECVQALESVALQLQGESGIQTRFSTGLESVMLPPRICGEVVRILQEALANVRKHSEAAEVQIQLAESNGCYHLSIQDDGVGFDFAGRFSLAQLDSMGKGPAVLKERVRLIGGRLEVESFPGRGSCLSISIPRAAFGN